MAAGDDNWDLSAVVRSCNSVPSAAAAAEEEISALSCLGSLTFEDDPNDVAFSFPGITLEPDDGFSELHQAFMSFLPNPDPTQLQFDPPGQNKPTPPRPGAKVVALQPRRWQPPSTPDFPNSRIRHSRIPKSRKRKSQQKRTVCLVTANNLITTDDWAWRKYGQKPIKGSPYPRNYYRCSSSKGCGARKQVERSNDDPETYIITYTGDHTHPRPAHRSSLAGHPRNQPSPPIPTINNPTMGDHDQSVAVGSCSSSVASSVTLLNNGNDGGNVKEREMFDHIVINSDDDNEDDDNDILIPNLTMRDEIFVGLEKFGYSP